MKRADVFALIDAEREHQAKLWAGEHAWGSGDCSSGAVPVAVKVAVLLEEAGEVAQAVLNGQGESMKEELVQVAAVAVAWLEGEA